MSISSALTADEIVFLAWEMLGVVPMGQAPTAIQKKRGRQALNSILKRLPQYGYSFPQLTEGRVALAIPAGTGKVALPINFYGAATLMIAEDEYRAGFNLQADDTTPGDLDTGQTFSSFNSGVWGRESGLLKLVSGATAPGLHVDSGFSDGEIGVTVSVNSNTQFPGIGMRLGGASNGLILANYAGTYSLVEVVDDVLAVLKTYSTVPANLDTLGARFVGPSITAIINGVEQTPHVTTRFLENTSHGIIVGANGTVPRFKNFYLGSGKQREVPILIQARYNSMGDRLQTATYPTAAMIDSGANLQVWPLPTSTLRGLMTYQEKIADTATNTAPEIDEAFHWDIAKGVACQVAHFVGRQDKIAKLEKEWEEARTYGILAQDGHGSFQLDYDEG